MTELLSPSFLIVDDGLPPREVFPTATRFEIGRDAARDVFLHHPTVSRYHAVVWSQRRRFFLEDVGSRYGTFVNHRLIPSRIPVPLGDGDVLQLGDVRVLCRLPGDSTSPSTGDDAFAARANARVLVVQEDQVERRLLSRAETWIGCGPHCEVALNHPTEGPLEEALLRAAGGLYRVQSRSRDHALLVNDLHVPLAQWVVLPKHSALVLHRAQLLFLYDFDADGRLVEDPLQRRSQRWLLKHAAPQIGVTNRFLKELLGQPRFRGWSFGEVLVMRQLLTPASWRALYGRLIAK